MPYIPTPHVAFSHKTRALRHVLVKVFRDIPGESKVGLYMRANGFLGSIKVPENDRDYGAITEYLKNAQ